MTVLLALLALAPTPAPADNCDAECRAVLQAALEWTLERVPSDNRGRIFVDVGGNRTGWEEESPESRAQTQVLRQLAAMKGIPVLRREDDPRFERCRTEPDSRACRAFAGTTAITWVNLQFLTADEATIIAKISVINEEGASSPEHHTSWELLLRRTGEAWQVDEAQIGFQS